MPFKDLPEGQTQYLDENGNTVTPDNIIVSINVRLGELDLDISQAKRNYLRKSESVSKLMRLPVQYASCYYEGVFDTLTKERETLQKIMRGEYGRQANE